MACTRTVAVRLLRSQIDWWYRLIENTEIDLLVF